MPTNKGLNNYGLSLFFLLTVLSLLSADLKAAAGELIITGQNDNKQSDLQPSADGIVIIHPQSPAQRLPLPSTQAPIFQVSTAARNNDAFVWIDPPKNNPVEGVPEPIPDTESTPYLPQRRLEPESQQAPRAAQGDGSPPDHSSLTSSDLVEQERKRIISAGIRVASRMNTTFKCAAGVQVALQEAGQPEFLGAGDGWPMRKAFFDSPKWQVTNNPDEATAFVRSWTDNVVQSYGDKYQGRNLGHVGLIFRRKDKLIELSDHEQVHNPDSPRYSQTIYFKYVG